MDEEGKYKKCCTAKEQRLNVEFAVLA